jgi:hypothetical protein
MRAIAVIAALLLLACGDPQQQTHGPTETLDVPDNQSRHWISSDPRYAATFDFNLAAQSAIPASASEVYVEVRGCRDSTEPTGSFRFKMSGASTWQTLAVDRPLCGATGEPSKIVWLPVVSGRSLTAEALTQVPNSPGGSSYSYVMVTVKVLGWKTP